MKTILSILYIALCNVLLAQKYTGDSWAKVKANGGTLTVIYYSQPGLIFKDETTGKMEGMCVDILEDFCKFIQTNYGKTLTINYAGEEPVFSTFLSITKTTPNIMGITNTTITEERKKILKFTPAFLSNPTVLITHKDAPTIKELSEISTAYKGYKARIIEASTHVKTIEKIKKDHASDLSVSYASSGQEILKEMVGNSKIITILDFTEYVDATRKQQPVKRQPVSVGEEEQLAFVMAKQTDWDEPWNKFLTPDYKKTVRYRKLIVDNLGASFLGTLKQ